MTFMDLQRLNQQINQLDDEPPFDSWQPENCGDIDIVIKQDGTWWHEGSPIGRKNLVKLLARVLIKEGDDYFLKTPAEKMRIQVEDAPFVITSWQTLTDDDESTHIEVTTNLDRNFIVSQEHPISVNHENPDDPSLYVECHRGLLAKVHRNVYYQWIEMATEQTINNQSHLIVNSAGSKFSLGMLE